MKWGKIIKQEVEYEWKPTLCKYCKNTQINNTRDYNRSHKMVQANKEWKLVKEKEHVDKKKLEGGN